MTNPQRDAQLERWLTSTPAGADVASPDCLDVETIAAFADNGLAPPERERAMSHAAGCARCQAVLAALGRTADVPAIVPPEPEVAPRAWWWRWLLPGAAAATAIVALAVWIRTPLPTSTEDVVTTAQRAPETANEQPPATVETRESAPVAAGSSPNTAPSAASAASREVPAPAPAAGTPAPQAPSASAAPSRVEGFALRSAPAVQPAPQSADKRAADAVAPEPAAVAPPSPAAAAAPAAGGGAAADAAAQPTPAPQVLSAPGASANTARAAAPSQSRERPEATRATTLAESVQVAQPWTLVAPPGGTSRWRFAGTRVERSNDGGVNWRAAGVAASAPLRAGSAPSAQVCWLVGQSGLVLRTVDAERWDRVGFPEGLDLVAVSASDAAHARVTASDGRVFETTDGGQTWQVR